MSRSPRHPARTITRHASRRGLVLCRSGYSTGAGLCARSYQLSAPLLVSGRYSSGAGLWREPCVTGWA